ncbi:MAG: hypothetical protein JKY49_01445 [Cohaesibacteraceae bacterium]|nr:hypothetical protein [Cohaesibacteraceae bacterium]MBL4876219.1 hypothetical protein [Cohaesibacteraceae bacterium]
MGIIWDNSLPSFLLLTVVLGGGAAWMSGRAVAISWQSFVVAAVYTLMLALAVRFLNFALLDGILLSIYHYGITVVVLMIIAGLAYRLTRVKQMTTQYSWQYERSGLLGWRAKEAE